MKANRNFVQADEAVSPVIAVILMVAITVVLAATVFVLVSDIGSNTSKAAPAVTFRIDEGLDQLIVDTAPPGADWNRMGLALKARAPAAAIISVGDDALGGNGATTFQNEAALNGGAGNNLPAQGATPLELTGANTVIRAGDYMEFCSDTASTVDVIVIVSDTTANSVINEYSFRSIANTGC